MSLIAKILCFLGVVDGAFLLLAPQRWFSFWIPILEKIRTSRKCSIAFGALEVGTSLWLLRRLMRG